MTNTTAPQPIPFDEVAWVAFDGERPVVICSAEMYVLSHSITDCLENGMFDFHFTVGQIHDAFTKFDWRLYRTEDAKAVFFGEEGGLE